MISIRVNGQDVQCPESFWDRVRMRLERDTMPVPESGCLIWLGSIRSRRGYGLMYLPAPYTGKQVHVHRLAWQLAYGPIPEGMNICHKCDVTSCVQNNHLFLGTQKDNIMDCVMKGRSGHTNLTYMDVIKIRKEYEEGEGNGKGKRKGKTTYAALGEKYGVSAGCIHLICQYKTWLPT